MSEVEPRVTCCCLTDVRRHFKATLKKFLLHLPSKKYALPEKLKSVIDVDMFGIKPKNLSNYKKRVEKLNEFMSAKARAVLNAETGPGKSFRT